MRVVVCEGGRSRSGQGGPGRYGSINLRYVITLLALPRFFGRPVYELFEEAFTGGGNPRDDSSS